MDSHPKTYILLIFGRNLKQEITSPPLLKGDLGGM